MGETRALIDVGMIALGPELERRPIFREISRLSRALLPESDVPSVKVVFVVPGSLGKPDFKDFELASPSRPGRTTQVFAAVPDDVARSGAPMEALIDLARLAVNFAGGQSLGARGSFQVAKISRALDVAESAVLSGETPASRTDRPAGRLARATQRREADETPASALIRLPTGDTRSSNEAAFALEAELDEHLTAQSIGYVDGNEIGHDTFEIFAYGRSAEALRESVLLVVREHWAWPGATVSLLDQEVEIERVTI